MLKLFTPDYYIHSFAALRPQYLKEHGIRLLVCDIDNTLVPHDVAVPDEKAVRFIRGMQKAGIRVVFISNNVEERVMTFAKGLDADCYPFAMKPLPKTYWKMLKEQGVEKQEVAVIGDQLMTDILGANLVGLHTVLTAPVVTRDLSFTKFNRFFESIVFQLLQKTGRLRKGEFDE
ncbi:YqeG family HAD IIIA-type phosphatase [[Clostridium] innocuum]|nr:YqeG family HAD IIIA-type phosphatase [[Clostridium] innocuum]